MDLATAIFGIVVAVATVLAALFGAVVWVSKSLVGDLPDRVKEVESKQAQQGNIVAGHEALFAATLGELRGEMRATRDRVDRVSEQLARLDARVL